MKKIIILAAFCIGIMLPAISQEGSANPVVNKKGVALLPEAGDFAIGIEANPFLKYFGNIFNQAGTNSAPVFSGVNQTLYGKYFLSDRTAIRVKLAFDFSQTKLKQTLRDDYALLIDETNIAATTIDTYKKANRGLLLTAGYEMRRGKGRLQGFYGGEFNVGFLSVKDNFIYGNAITADFSNPSTTAFAGVNNTTVIQGDRMLENKKGAIFSIGLGGFAGVEYFFAPQISIGGELGLGFTYDIKGQDEIKTEGWVNSSVQEYNYRNRSQADTAFETGIRTIPSGNIFLIFHF